MSDYASIDDLKKRIKGFEDLYNDGTGAFDDAQATADLNDAQSQVDSYAGVRYAIPVTDPGSQGILRSLTLSLAEEFAWSRGDRGSLPENVQKRIETARQQLKDLSSGAMALGSAAEKGSSAGGASEVIMSEPVCKRDQLRGW